MKRGEAFALNPNAPSYIPLSKRQDYHGSDESALCATPATLSNDQSQRTRADYGGDLTMNTCSTPVPTTEHSFGSYASHQLKPGQMSEEDFDMELDMEYLVMSFSGLSHESITDAYLANNGDLEATLDMLTQLEMYCAETPETLPETLDIGDVCESGPSTSAALKHKNAVSKGGASSSAPAAALNTAGTS